MVTVRQAQAILVIVRQAQTVMTVRHRQAVMMTVRQAQAIMVIVRKAQTVMTVRQRWAVMVTVRQAQAIIVFLLKMSTKFHGCLTLTLSLSKPVSAVWSHAKSEYGPCVLGIFCTMVCVKVPLKQKRHRRIIVYT